MNDQVIIERLLESARYGDVDEFLDLSRNYFISINEDPSDPQPSSIRDLYRKAITNEGTTILHYAAANDHTDVINLFVQNLEKEDLNLKNKGGSAPVHWAAFNGCLKSIIVLANAGADLGLKNAQGKSPVTIAEMQGHTQVANEILKRLDIKRGEYEVEVTDEEEIGSDSP